MHICKVPENYVIQNIIKYYLDNLIQKLLTVTSSQHLQELKQKSECEN